MLQRHARDFLFSRAHHIRLPRVAEPIFDFDEPNILEFADYGFYPVQLTAGVAALELKDGSWRIYIEVLRKSNDGIIVCLST